MKQKSVPISILIALVVVLCAFSPRAARAQDEVSPEFFYDALAPYGEWVDVGDYGSCWHPTGVDDDWAPYTDGYWAYTDAGWTWVSYEEFGGIVYHYGRWMRVEGEGWCWVPDYDWAPAWVSWRSNDDYVGWAPLPPEARWRGDIGFSVWVDSAYDIGPGYYSFCRFRDFGAPVLRGVIVNREENFALIGRTRNITNITYTNFGGARVVFNGGPNFAVVRGVVSHPIPALNLVRNSRFDPAQLRGPGVGKLFAGRTAGNQLFLAAPLIARPADANLFKGRAKKTIEAAKVTKGWAGIKDPAASQQLRQQIQAQTKGAKPETAHARPVAPADLKVVPSHVNETGSAGERPRGRNEKPTPSAAVVTKPSVPVVPAIVPSVPHVNTPSGNPTAGPGADVRKPFAPGEERKPDLHVRPPEQNKPEQNKPDLHVRPPESNKPEPNKPDIHVRPPADAGAKERAIEREKPVEREKPAIPQAPHVAPQPAVQPPSPQRPVPHEEPRSQPSEKKGNPPPGKEKDKDKDKDKDKKNGN